LQLVQYIANQAGVAINIGPDLQDRRYGGSHLSKAGGRAWA
jgi:hypothetical protein